MKYPKIGLALGSGGARGLAHIGVIKVLEENNIPIDFIAGSSMGAMVGGFYAANKDINQAENLASEANLKLILSLIDPSLRQGMLGGKKVNNFIENQVGGVSFKDLKIPLSIVATNLKNGDSVVINKGNLAAAIRASISIPIVFKPIAQEDKLLVDGGLSLPVPADIVKKMGADVVIAVNLDADYFSSESKKFGFYKIAENSINLLRHHLAYSNIKDADIVINPRVGRIHWNKFLGGQEIIAAGEAATREVLPQLRGLLQKDQGGLKKYLKFLRAK